MLKLFAAFLALCFAALAPAQVSAKLNAAIAKAVAKGAISYSLPAKAILDGPLVIPSGTKDFKLVGRKGGTTLTSKTRIGYAITAGVQTLVFNNYPVNAYPSVEITNVPDGATTLTLATPLPVKAGDLLALYDKSWVKHAVADDAQLNHEEVVEVASVQDLVVTLTRPVSREYDVGPRVANVTAQALRNVTFENIAFDASIAGSKDRNNGILTVGLAKGVTIRNLSVSHFSSRALATNWANDLLIEDCKVADGADAGVAGNAYGFTLVKTHRAHLKGCVADSTRHGFVAHNGSTDVLFEDCQSLGDNGNFDTHGMDERRLTFLRCKATGTLNVGNGAYLAGARDVAVVDSDFLYAAWFSGNVRGFRAVNSSFWGVSWESKENTKGYPASGKPVDIRFERCRFKFVKSAFQELGDIDLLAFDRCTFENDVASFTILFALEKTTGRIQFDDCVLRSNATANYFPIQVKNASPTFTLVMRNTTIESVTGKAGAAIQVFPSFAGNVSLDNVTFKSGYKTPAILLNQSVKKIDVTTSVAKGQ